MPSSCILAVQFLFGCVLGCFLYLVRHKLVPRPAKSSPRAEQCGAGLPACTPVYCSSVPPIIMSSPVIEVQLGPTYGAQLLATFLSVALWGTASMQT